MLTYTAVHHAADGKQGMVMNSQLDVREYGVETKSRFPWSGRIDKSKNYHFEALLTRE